MASYGLGMGGVDNSHDCILLIQPHHLAFGKIIESFTLKANCIFNKTVLLKAKIFLNHVQSYILAKLKRPSACIILPMPDKNSLKNFESRRMALYTTLNIACHRSNNRSKALSSVQSLSGSFCLPHMVALFSVSSEYSELSVLFSTPSS